KLIIEERQREMPFTERWYDIRRLNNNEDSNDDVGELTRNYFPYSAASVLTTEEPITYTLSKDSRRYAAPIPEADITASNGAIEQNEY
ncbi:MAG: RagB/SusD family nutrient uptake outer membrane protein, partial [Bacteroidales bacterium]